ncbi:MAG TPA: hypothetical protein VJQ84_00800 [Solirubrobacterales bacterium]|nr:hypothetical protein [Solirubrobacterales bacterium]
MEERLVWGGADGLRRLAEIVKWPFERLVWAIERGLVWPLEERTGRWGPSLRVAGIAALALLAAGAGVAGLVLASGDGGNGGGGAVVSKTAAPASPPAAAATPKVAPTAAAPVLQGAKPDFATEAGDGVAKSPAEAPALSDPGSSTSTAGSTAEVARSSPSSDAGSTPAATGEKVAGPAAIKVAHQFAGAFVLYEIGRKSSAVHKVFDETATPQLTHALLRRPPRQPAGTEVPKAKVLNIVPGPHHGDTYTISVSLLRVGVTSELRLDMQRDEKSGEWRVTDALG